MKHIKMFNEHKLGETGLEYLTDEEFKSRREEMVKQIKMVYDNYEKFTRMVSPKNWRTTGHHLTSLRGIMEDMYRFQKISQNDLKSEYVRKSVNDES